MLRDTTFGNFRCSIILVNKINKIDNLNLRKKISSKVSRFLNEFYKGIIHIDLMNDPKIKITLLNMWKNKFLSKIDFDCSVDTYIKNVTVTRFRESHRKALIEKKEFRKKELAKMRNR